ncbi:MAG: chemotaxis protein CheB [Planctomycetota bacterium]
MTPPIATIAEEPAALPSTFENVDEVAELGEGLLFPIVGIGASAGGLEAFTQLLKALPSDTGMAFVLVQHLAPTHSSALAEILSRVTKMPVTEVRDESIVQPNHVYVIPPDRSLVTKLGTLQLLPREGQGIHRPVDQFFRSLAEDRRHQAIGVVLSGTASDGTLGLEAIKDEGGITFAQDATAQCEGMPHSAIASGCVDFVLSPSEIAQEIVRIGHHPYAVPKPIEQQADDKPNLAEIVQLLHHTTGVDFTHYKINTLYRRVTRRMVLQKMDGLSEYAAYLQETPAEVEALYQDILISVTSFFRDPAAFEVLKTTVFPRLLKDRSRHDPVRIWTLGCSSGQEAYSLAMAFTEAAEAAGSSVPCQLFATDLNPAVIDKARAGIYSIDIALDVSPERLQRFFTETDGKYRISKTIRDACVFSRHNVLADPPFSRIDLISCRNLLIYLEPVLQQRIMPTLHYALKPGGSLWLGGSETIGDHQNLFDVEDAKYKIFTKKLNSNSGSERGPFSLQRSGAPRSSFIPIPTRLRDTVDLPREADRVLLTKFAPPGVLVSPDLEILQYRGDTGPFLAPAPGKASLNLLKMLREGLLVAVRAALLRAGKEEVPIREEGLRVKSNGGYLEVAIEVIPIKGNGAETGGFLVIFEDCQHQLPPNPKAHPKADRNVTAAGDVENSRLAQELAATREYLQSVIEQQDAANEELQSANEEVQSANEELQSTNEELETSKEEIQSSNEELATVNEELNDRIAESNRVNNDLVNLIGSGQMAIVMLGPDLRVRMFTPLAEKLLNLIPSDQGRPLADIKLHLDNIQDLEPLLKEVLELAVPQEHEVRDKHGRWFSLRLRPYKTLDNKLDGVVLMLVDIDAMRHAHDRARESDAQYHAMFDATSVGVSETEPETGRLLRVNEQFTRILGYSAAELVGRTLLELTHPDDQPQVAEGFSRLMRGEIAFHETEKRLIRKDGTLAWVHVTINLVRDAQNHPLRALAITLDVSERKQTEAALNNSEVRYRRLFETAKDGILIVDVGTQKITHVNPFLMNLLDYPADHFLGKELWEIGFLRDKEASRSAMQQLNDEGSIRYENLPLEDRHRALHPVEMVANVYQEGSQWVIQCNIRDISDRSRLEMLLRGQASELSELHRRKDEFLAMLSHELRSPLAPIANAVQLLGLQRGNETRIQQQARGIIERQLGQLQHLVDDLLEVSRITSGRVQLMQSRVAVSGIVNGAIETTRPLIEQYGHELTLSLPTEPIWLHADAARLEQVLINLLTNAAKFTEEGGRIWVTVQREGDECQLRVRDSGVGITAALMPHIFELFTQAERTLDRSQGGLGIGLALVQRLTELHGGKVEVHSDLGQGTEFIVRLPVIPGDLPQPLLPTTIASQPITRSLKVLVVDDNADTTLSFSMLLRSLGHDVRTAHDGPSGVSVAIEYQPEVAMLDIGLPGLNGFEVAKRIRQEPALKDIMLIALTGYGQETDRQTSHEAGFNHHLVKPADFGKLQQILATLSDSPK